MGWITKNNREEWIKKMAKHYGEPIEQVREEVDKNPEILEGFVDYLVDDYESNKSGHKHYRNNYYE